MQPGEDSAMDPVSERALWSRHLKIRVSGGVEYPPSWIHVPIEVLIISKSSSRLRALPSSSTRGSGSHGIRCKRTMISEIIPARLYES